MTPAKCRSCGAAIFWAKHCTTKKLLPVDATPHPLGTFWLTKRGTELEAQAVGEGEEERNRWVSHFATCPHAAQHRKPKTEELF